MRRLPFPVLIVAVLATALVAVDWLSPFDTRMYDELMRMHQREAPEQIVLIAIDGDSERRYPDFVDRRPLALARLVDRLNQVKPRVIGAYMYFDPRDPRDKEGLEVLRAALGRHGNTVGKVFVAPNPHRSAEEGLAIAEKVGFHTLGLQRLGIGDDNVIRGSFYAAPLAGALRSSFAMALLQQSGDLLPIKRREQLTAILESPRVEDTFYAFAFLGPARSVRTISAADVLDGTVHPEAWRDRIVIIGQSEQDHQVNLTTAVSAWAAEDLTVDELEAQAAAALFTGHVFRLMPLWGDAAIVGLLVLGFGVLIARVPQQHTVWVATGVMAAMVLAYLLAYRLMYWLPPVALLIAMPSLLGLEFARRFSRAASQLAAELAVLRREAEASTPIRGAFDFEHALAAVREAIGSIRQQREYVHRLFDVQPAAIVVVDAQQRIRLSNALALAWRTDSEAPSSTLRDWLAAVELALPADAGTYLGAGSARLLARCGERDVIVAFEPLPAGRDQRQHDTMVCVTEVSSLIADQREREAAIDFLSHDLRAPAHALIELCEGAQQDSGLAPNTRELLQVAERLSRRMVHTATTYLDFVRAASPEAFTRNEPVLLADVLIEAVETSAPEASAKGVRIDLQLEDGEPGWVTGDSALLRRAVENLLSNAVHVTPAEGCVEVALSRRGSALAIVVRDEGPGIAPSRRSQLFQPFGPLARTPKGSARSMGLGLAMVMSVVARHRGTVFVDNRVEGGAEFRIELPMEQLDENSVE